MKRIFEKLIYIVLVAALLCGLLSGCAPSQDKAAAEQTMQETEQAAPMPEEQAQTEPVTQQTPMQDAEAVQAEAADEAQLADGGESWSVFLYLCGTDLESDEGAATANIAEAAAVSLPENVNFIIQTGGTEQWGVEGISTDSLQRYRLVPEDIELVDEKPSASMGDAQTLGEFLAWGVEQYPADRYMTILWNHGGGSVAGVAFDELYDNDSLSLTELSTGLSMAGAEFEVVGFDACLMATLETASAIAPYAKYMVASEEFEPGGGWDYTAWLSALAENPAADGLELGKAICDSYYEKCALSGEEAMATLSVTELSQTDALVEAFDGMAQDMAASAGDVDGLRNIVQGAGRTESYGGNTDEEGYTNMVDLNHLAQNIAEVTPNSAEEVSAALDSAVKYSVKGEQRAEASGISVFYPLGTTEDELTSYAEVATSGAYLRFMESLYGWQPPEDAVAEAPAMEESVSAEDFDVQYEATLDEEGVFGLQVTSGLETLDSVMFNLYYMDEEYSEYMLMGIDNDIDSDWENGLFKDNFRGVWPTINGNYCAPELIEEGEDYNLYSIPAVLNGEETNLRAAYIFDGEESGHFEIYGAWNGIDSDTGSSSRNITKLKDGDEIAFVFKSINWDTGEETSYTLGSFIVYGEAVMEESRLFDGDYLYQYEVKDIFGNVTYSDTVIMECKNGEISVYETEDAA